MKNKSAKLEKFIRDLHVYVVNHPRFRENIGERSEAEIQTEIWSLILNFLEEHFEREGYKNYVAKAHKSLYWEGQEGQYGREKTSTFGTKNYPDFVISDPYLIAIEYKQSPSGSIVKHGIGQSIMHTLCEEFHYVYFLFHDESEDKRIKTASMEELETSVIKQMWQNFNVYIEFT